MKMRRNIIAVIFALSLGATNAQNIYVSTNGSNDSEGTILEPYQSIQFAVENSKGLFDTLFIEGGVYNERVTIEEIGSVTNPFCVTSYNGIATIDGTAIELFAPSDGLVEMIDCQFGTFDNLRVTNSEYIGFLVYGDQTHNATVRNCSTIETGSSGIYVNGDSPIGVFGVSDILIENNSIERAVNFFGGYEECITITEGVENFIIRNNTVFNGGDGTLVGGPIGIDAKNGARNGDIYENLVYDINGSASGIYVDAWDNECSNIRVYRNVVYECEDIGISVGAEMGGTVDSVFIYNNLIYRNGSDGIKISGFMADGSGEPNDIRRVFVYNNTVVENGYQDILNGQNQGGAMWIEGNTGLITVVNNIFSNNNFNNGVHIYLSNMDSTFISHNLIDGDRERTWDDPPMQEILGENFLEDLPGFENSVADNFRLEENSPAIDSGTDFLFPQDDIDQNPRPVNNLVDLGCYEFNPSLSIRDSQRNLLAVLFPNPATDKINLITNLRGDLIIDIYSYDGRIQKQFQPMNSEDLIQLGVSDLAAGIYLIQIRAGSSEAITQKLLISK